MLLNIGIGVGLFILGYFVGANNPWPSVKKKIIAGAQSELNKVVK